MARTLQIAAMIAVSSTLAFAGSALASGASGGHGSGGAHASGRSGAAHVGRTETHIAARPSVQIGHGAASPGLSRPYRGQDARGSREGSGYGYPRGTSYSSIGDVSDAYSSDDSQPIQEGRSVADGSDVCSTPVKSCHLGTMAEVGTPCWCHVPGGRSGGHVTN